MHPDPLIQRQINKRLTLNLLIQGFAVYAGSTAHRLVRRELEHISPGITRRFNRLTAGIDLTQHVGSNFLLQQSQRSFWRSTRRTTHPFYSNALLRGCGPELRAAERRRVKRASWRTALPPWLVVSEIGAFWRLGRTVWAERTHHDRLAETARLATHRVWGIDPDLLIAEYAFEPEIDGVREPETWQGRLMRHSGVGWSGVVRLPDGRLGVHARAWTWPLLVHELIKGVAELVCLHGLNRLDDQVYTAVIAAVDHIEHEIWMMQAGPELVRRLIALVEPDPPPAIYLMEIAKLEPDRLEDLMLAVVDAPDRARRLLAELVAHHTAPLDDTVGLG
ncbi:MAG: hypothetical protein AAGI68_05825 [Planctomycetota bacterium]